MPNSSDVVFTLGGITSGILVTAILISSRNNFVTDVLINWLPGLTFAIALVAASELSSWFTSTVPMRLTVYTLALASPFVYYAMTRLLLVFVDPSKDTHLLATVIMTAVGALGALILNLLGMFLSDKLIAFNLVLACLAGSLPVLAVGGRVFNGVFFCLWHAAVLVQLHRSGVLTRIPPVGNF